MMAGSWFVEHDYHHGHHGCHIQNHGHHDKNHDKNQVHHNHILIMVMMMLSGSWAGQQDPWLQCKFTGWRAPSQVSYDDD